MNETLKKYFKFKDFNAMQKACFNSIYEGTNNIVVSAPTGTGKSVLFDFAIIAHSESKVADKLMVYLAPTKALCGQKYADLKKRFKELRVNELTSETINSLAVVSGSDLVVATPEKLEIMTRDNALLKRIGLLMIDEVHLVNDKRGSVLECLVARLKLYELKTAKYLRPRIVMVSATFPNAADFETWLDSHEADEAQNGGKDTELFVFGDDVKSVTVSRTVIGFTNKKNNAWLLEQSMNRDLYKILERNDALSETVVFCNTRKSCENTSEELKKNFKKVFQLNDKVECKKLKELLQFGLAFHHGGVQQSDRLIIEKLFAEKKIHILCATTTLCVGVNLPINCVVVKSTQIYNSEKKKYEEYSDNDVLQMIGRAGRNTNGKVIIMTDKQRVSHFELLFKGKEIESSLLSKEDGTATLDTLKELIVNEVLAGLIRSGDDCLRYLKETFLAVRLGRGSLFYMPLLRSVLGFKGSLKNYDSVLPKLSKLVMDGLQKDGLLSPSVTAAEEPKTAEVLMSDTSIEIKSLGLSKPGPTLKYIRDHLKHNSTVALVFETLCNVPEFQCEKKHLDTLPDTKLKEFTLPLQISSYNKVFALLLAGLCGMLTEKKQYTVWYRAQTVAKKIAKTMIIYLENSKRLDGETFKSVCMVLKMVNAGKYEGSGYEHLILTQIEKVGPKISQGLLGMREMKGVEKDYLKALLTATSSSIEVAAHRNPPFGMDCKENAKKIPLLDMKYDGKIRITHCYSTQLGCSWYLLALKGEMLSLFKKVTSKQIGKELLVDVEPQVTEVLLICEKYIGVDCSLSSNDVPITPALSHVNTTKKLKQTEIKRSLSNAGKTISKEPFVKETPKVFKKFVLSPEIQVIPDSLPEKEDDRKEDKLESLKKEWRAKYTHPDEKGNNKPERDAKNQLFSIEREFLKYEKVSPVATYHDSPVVALKRRRTKEMERKASQKASQEQNIAKDSTVAPKTLPLADVTNLMPNKLDDAGLKPKGNELSLFKFKPASRKATAESSSKLLGMFMESLK